MIENLKAFLKVTEQDQKNPTILKQKDDVFYLLLNTKANSFTKEFVRAIHKELDKVQAHQGPTTLVTASLSKIFSGGLDLKYTSSLNDEERRYFIIEFMGLAGRISTLPFPTISLVRGGAVAGGCMFAFAHDFVYASGKALFLTNQSQKQMPFPPGLMTVIKKRNAYASTIRNMLILSKPFSAEQALNQKLIDGIWSQQQTVKQVHSLASQISQFGQNKVNMKKIKSQLYKQLIRECFSNQLAPHNIVGYSQQPFFSKL